MDFHYDFVNRAMEPLLKTSVSVKDINWVGSWVITLPREPYVEADEHDFQVLRETYRRTDMALIIS